MRGVTGTDKREYMKAYSHELYRWYKEHGVCTQCGKQKAEPHKTMCIECATKQAEAKRNARRNMSDEQRQEWLTKLRDLKREAYKRRKAQGQCVRCGKPVKRGGVRCFECEQVNRRYSALAREKRRVKTRFDKGLCSKCNEPALPGMKLCEKHYASFRIVQQKAWSTPVKPDHPWRRDNEAALRKSPRRRRRMNAQEGKK